MKGLILSDGKAGHVNQSRAFCALIGADATESRIEFKSEFEEHILRARMNFRAKEAGGIFGLLGMLGVFLSEPSILSVQQAIKQNPDFVVSAGSAVAAANLLISSFIGARSVAIMKPSALPLERFDLIVLPEHDRKLKAPENMVFSPVALSFFSAAAVSASEDGVRSRFGDAALDGEPLALVIGGDSKYFSADADSICSLVSECTKWAKKCSRGIIGTTSRRTPAQLEDRLKELAAGLSSGFWVWGRTDPFNPLPAMYRHAFAAVITEDSVSMISEAVTQGIRPVVVSLKKKRPLGKLDKFREYLERNAMAVWAPPADAAGYLENKKFYAKTSSLNLESLRIKILRILDPKFAKQ